MSAFSAEEIRLIQESFRAIAPVAPQLAAAFYARLFQLDPALRGLFHGDMREQGRKLMGALGLVVNSLDQMDTLLPAVRALGARHAGYGVREAHFGTVGAALLDTLAGALGPEFTASVRAAWTKAYGVVAAAMIDAMRTAGAKTGPAPQAA